MIDLRDYSTFKIGGTTSHVFSLHNEKDTIEASDYAEKENKRLIIIGEGSNTIFSDNTDTFVIGHMNMKGINLIEDTKTTILTASAGEIWDNIVVHSINAGLSGIEALSGIPGTVGAAPIQNIGAYGSEVADTLISVSVYNRKNKSFESLTKEQCEFSYRDSIFKKHPEQYIILGISLRLSTSTPSLPSYASLKFDPEKEITGLYIREVVLATRANKLPDYKLIPNCGSFFKNPFVDVETFKKIQEKYPNIPHFETPSGLIKLFAGWLIEQADCKTLESKNIGFYENNKLVLFNKGDANFDELTHVIQTTQNRVKEIFGVDIEPEPNLY